MALWGDHNNRAIYTASERRRGLHPNWAIYTSVAYLRRNVLL